MKICKSCNYVYDSPGWICPNCDYSPEIKDGIRILTPENLESSDSFPTESFVELAKHEDSHFWFKARNKIIQWGLKTYLPIRSSFLEIGCGTGFVINGIRKVMPDMRVVGSELFIEGLEVAKDRLKGVDLYQLDALRIPFNSEFEIIGAFDVIEHIDDDVKALEQIYQALKFGGGVMVTVPQHKFLWSALDDASLHKRRYTKKELVGQLTRI